MCVSSQSGGGKQLRTRAKPARARTRTTMTVSSCPRHPSHIVIVAVALALTTYSATPALAYAFAPSSLTAPTNPVSSNTAKRVGVGRAAGTQEEKPLSVPAHSQRRRAGLISRKARVRPRGTAAAPAKSAGTTQQQRVNLERVGGVGDLVRCVCVFGCICSEMNVVV